MTPDQREKEIATLRDALITCAQDVEILRERLDWRRASIREMQADLAALIAQRSPDEIERLERERGLR